MLDRDDHRVDTAPVALGESGARGPLPADKVYEAHPKIEGIGGNVEHHQVPGHTTDIESYVVEIESL